MKRNLRWEKHGDLYVAKDADKWTRYIVYYDIGWEAIGPLGLSMDAPMWFTDTNKRRLMAEIAKDWRNR